MPGPLRARYRLFGLDEGPTAPVAGFAYFFRHMVTITPPMHAQDAKKAQDWMENVI
jgi:hypothetical protein